MTLALIIVAITIMSMLVCIVFFPKISIKKFDISTYWLVALLGAVLLLCTSRIDFQTIYQGLTENSAINPLKILALFLSMTFLSIVLDELGFFKYIALKAVSKTKAKQIHLFLILYALTSFLTVFTSNDIIILTFTPFIIFFCKNAKINPIPYLVSEFISANTWSMLFIIGNPTNIYLATKCGFTFVTYLEHMYLPTIFGGLTSFGLLLLVFHKQLKEPLDSQEETIILENKPMIILNLVCLGICTIMLVICSYINLEMWIISVCAATALVLCLIAYSIIKKSANVLSHSLIRIPWALIPFIISMFTIVLTLKKYNITSTLASTIGNTYPIIKYGSLSMLFCNLINNIPMSVFFAEIINSASPAIYSSATFATIIGSNIGAFLSPIGALAGIMWMTILKKHEIPCNFITFMKYGCIIAIPTLIMSLFGLFIIL